MTPSERNLEQSVSEAAKFSNAWPFEEAKKLVERIRSTGQKSVIFETGYGPSGLPHIGTFGEVARTTMVRNAFRVMTEDKIQTRLIAFSDDMDGLRKVPDNIPNKEMIAPHLGKPLTKVPDPFGTHDSFGAHNNARLRAFLDRFEFEYEFMSATEAYTTGLFDKTLLRVLQHYDEVMDIMLPSLREERAQSYSPFLPIHPESGHVLQVPIDDINRRAGTLVWRDPANGECFETPVTGGRCKLQWKPDWAMRWVALGIDYEMAGKDLIDSVKLSARICRTLGQESPEGFNYELFLDERGQKISKSKGNGLSIEEWLTYASPESLSHFMYSKPREAKKLYFDVIPRQVDDYLASLEKFPLQTAKEKLGNPAWHIHNGCPPRAETISDIDGHAFAVSFGMLLNLVAVANSDDKQVLWGFIRRYAPDASAENHPKLDQMVSYAVAYYRDFVRPTRSYRLPNPVEHTALLELADAFRAHEGSTDGGTLQSIVYEIGRKHFPDLTGKTKSPDGRPGVSQQWFSTLYQVLLGAERGPRFGSFAALYSVSATRSLILKALKGDLISAQADDFEISRQAKDI